MCGAEARAGNKISILGVPSPFGQPHQGVALGPAALRRAGLVEKLELAGWQVNDLGNLPCFETKSPQGQVAPKNLQAVTAISWRLYQYLLQLAEIENTIPLLLGGDHSISIGSIAALAESYSKLGVIWFDAHPDLNTLETSPSGNIHGMSLAIALGRGMPELVGVGNIYPKLRPENVVIIGARSIDRGEEELIKEKGITLYTMAEVRSLGIEEIIGRTLEALGKKTGGVHLSFDLDCLDPFYAPGVGTPVPGGISYQEAELAMELLNRSNLITSAEIVELNPLFDKDNKTAKKAVQLTLTLFQNKGDLALKA